MSSKFAFSLFFLFLSLQAGSARGEPGMSSTSWWQCGLVPTESPHSRTPEQDKKLMNFAIRIFLPELSNDPSSRISPKTLISRFGSPIRSAQSERRSYDPGDPMEIVTIWDYPGFSLTTVASKPKPDELFVETGTISGNDIPLQFGIRIGQSIDQWASQFGKPVCSISDRQRNDHKEFELTYEPEHETFVSCADGSCLVNYSINLTVDINGKVKRMQWSYPMM